MPLTKNTNKIIKNLFKLAKFGLLSGLFFGVSFAQQGRWGNYGSDPTQILDTVAGEANKEYRIQETALDTVSNLDGSYGSQYRIANTLDSIRIKITPYMQWAVFIGLSAAVILIIYNGFILVTSSATGDGSIETAKKRITNVLIGVVIITGFYFMIQLVLSLLTAFA